MEKLLWKLYENVISKIFKKQIKNDIHAAFLDGMAEMELFIEDKVTYWEHIYPKNLLNQSYKILFDFKQLTFPR